MPNYTYLCSEGHENDAIRPVGTESMDCPQCGGRAQKRSVYAQAQIERERKITEAKDFFEASDMLESKRQEFEKREGVLASPPPLYRMAKAKAQRLLAQGAPDSKSVW